MSEVSSFPQFIEYQGVPMLNANEVSKFLGYSNLRNGLNKCSNVVKLSYKETNGLGLSNGLSMHGIPLIPVSDACKLVSFCRNDLTQVAVAGFLTHLNSVNDSNFIPVTTANEYVAIRTIEQILNKRLHRQYPCGKYKIDAYDKVSKIAYEIDEPFHRLQREADAERQAYIEDQLGCTFVRIKL